MVDVNFGPTASSICGTASYFTNNPALDGYRNFNCHHLEEDSVTDLTQTSPFREKVRASCSQKNILSEPGTSRLLDARGGLY